MTLSIKQSLAQQRGEADFDNDSLVRARERQIRAKPLSFVEERSLEALLPEQLAGVDRVVKGRKQRRQQIAEDIKNHDELAVEWYVQQGHGDLVTQLGVTHRDGVVLTTPFSLVGRAHARPRGAGRPARSSTRSTRGSPDDDSSEPEPHPCERPCDRLLFLLRNSYPDAYRVIAEADAWAWKARCPCAPDAGHTMFILDRGDDQVPGIACRHGCSTASIRRMLGFVTPEEEELERRATVFLEELERYQSWVAERRSS